MLCNCLSRTKRCRRGFCYRYKQQIIKWQLGDIFFHIPTQYLAVVSWVNNSCLDIVTQISYSTLVVFCCEAIQQSWMLGVEVPQKCFSVTPGMFFQSSQLKFFLNSLDIDFCGSVWLGRLLRKLFYYVVEVRIEFYSVIIETSPSFLPQFESNKSSPPKKHEFRIGKLLISNH